MPNNISYPYGVREATVEDAEAIAVQRSLMFREMGSLSEAEMLRVREASKPWIESLLVDRTYMGWLLLHNDVVVGGAGMHLRKLGPMPGCCEGGIGAHVANLYIDPPHRRRGLGETLMKLMMQWSKASSIYEMTLAASEEAKPLYRRLGFDPSEDFYSLKM